MRYYNKLFTLFTITIILVASSLFIAAKPTPNAVAPSIAPTSLTYSGLSTNEVTLSWQTVSGATGYKVYRATPNDSNYTLLVTLSTNSYKNTALTSNTKYWYFVRAYNIYGTSPESKHISLTSKKIVFGYTTYYYSGDASSYNSMTSNASSLNEIATNTYTTDAYGNISGMIPTNQITYANSKNIKTLAMITNNFDGNIAKALLESSINRQALIKNILSALKSNNYKGVNVDLEGLYYYDRSYLTTFMRELYTSLHSQGFYVTMAVPAKTTDGPTLPWSGAYDYASLAQYTDQVVLMTYDEHYPGGKPGAIASIGWVENVIKYAITVIPKTKLLLGTADYGYDWSSKGTKAYGISAIYNLASTYGATIKWDSVSQSAYFSYSDSAKILHTVWLENAESLRFKLNLVNSYNLSGIAIWRLGLEDASYWTSIKTKFN